MEEMQPQPGMAHLQVWEAIFLTTHPLDFLPTSWLLLVLSIGCDCLLINLQENLGNVVCYTIRVGEEWCVSRKQIPGTHTIAKEIEKYSIEGTKVCYYINHILNKYSLSKYIRNG